MRPAVHFWMVHQAVHPVKISVVDDDDQGYTQEQPGYRILVDFAVKLGVLAQGCTKTQPGCYPKNEGCECRITNFPPVITGPGKALLDFPTEQCLPSPDIKYQIGKARHDQITAKNNDGDDAPLNSL